MPTFAEALDELLRERGWKQKHLANEVGVSQPMVSKWLKGSIPDPENMLKIERAFGLTEGELSTRFGYVATSATPPVTLEQAIMREARLSRRARERLLAYFQGLLDASDSDRR